MASNRSKIANENFISLAKDNGWQILQLSNVCEYCIAICPNGHEVKTLPFNLKKSWLDKRKFGGCSICKDTYNANIEITCATCGNKCFKKKWDKGAKFCSKKCSSQAGTKAKKKVKDKRGIWWRSNGKTRAGEQYNNWTVLGPEFHIVKKWYVVCECKCGFINAVCVDDMISDNNKGCGCSMRKVPPINIGDIFEQLCVTSLPYYERFRKQGNEWRVNVKCECGWSGDVSAELLLKGRHFHKGCQFWLKFMHDICWKGYDCITGSHWCSIKNAAKIRNLDFFISINDAVDVYNNQNGVCKLSGWKLNNSNEARIEKTASLDRIDSSKGYEIGNIHWVHKDVNHSKLDFEQQKYIDFCYLISTKEKRQLKDIEIEIYKRNKRFGGYKNISLGYWNQIKNNTSVGCSTAYRSRINFSITIEYAWDVYVNQGGRCAKTGVPIFFGLPGTGSPVHIKQIGEGTASLDRIDSNKGYEVGNIQWVHKDVNVMKWDFDEQYFLKMCIVG